MLLSEISYEPPRVRLTLSDDTVTDFEIWLRPTISLASCERLAAVLSDLTSIGQAMPRLRQLNVLVNGVTPRLRRRHARKHD